MLRAAPASVGCHQNGCHACFGDGRFSSPNAALFIICKAVLHIGDVAAKPVIDLILMIVIGCAVQREEFFCDVSAARTRRFRCVNRFNCRVFRNRRGYLVPYARIAVFLRYCRILAVSQNSIPVNRDGIDNNALGHKGYRELLYCVNRFYHNIGGYAVCRKIPCAVVAFLLRNCRAHILCQNGIPVNRNGINGFTVLIHKDYIKGIDGPVCGEHRVFGKLIDCRRCDELAVFVVPSRKGMALAARRHQRAVGRIIGNALGKAGEIVAAVCVEGYDILICLPKRSIDNAFVNSFSENRSPSRKSITFARRLLALPCRRCAALSGVVYLILKNHSIRDTVRISNGASSRNPKRLAVQFFRIVCIARIVNYPAGSVLLIVGRTAIVSQNIGEFRSSVLFADCIGIIRELRVEFFHIRRKIRNGQLAVEFAAVLIRFAELISAGKQIETSGGNLQILTRFIAVAHPDPLRAQLLERRIARSSRRRVAVYVYGLLAVRQPQSGDLFALAV